MMALTAIIAFCTFVQAGSALLQNHNMRLTMEETRKAAEAAFASAWATSDQAQVAKDALAVSQANAEAANAATTRSLEIGEQHAAATQTAANAAMQTAATNEASVAHMRALERPWITFTHTGTKGLKKLEALTEQKGPLEEMTIPDEVELTFSLKVTNGGRTVARVQRSGLEFDFPGNSLPPIPDYGKTKPFAEQLWAPGQSSETDHTISIPRVYLERMLTAKTILALYGFIKYQGPLGDPSEDYESRFCLICEAVRGWLRPRIRFFGPKGYNEYK